MIFLFFKIIFNINISKQFKTCKNILNFNNKKFKKHNFLVTAIFLNTLSHVGFDIYNKCGNDESNNLPCKSKSPFTKQRVVLEWHVVSCLVEEAGALVGWSIFSTRKVELSSTINVWERGGVAPWLLNSPLLVSLWEAAPLNNWIMKILFFLGIHLLLLSFLANWNINGFVHSFEA
jgi:hypothetical protein